MDYAKFYISAQKMLIDYMTSIWFRGKPKEQEYLRYILSEKEPLLAEPVFQSIFPWEESKENFDEHSSKLHVLTQSFVDAISSESIKKDFRFPKERHPFKHQTKSWKMMLSGEGKTIVVTSGTGSGKTECFMIPVLQDIAERNEKDCVQAIFLYPLNALMKSQQQRMDAWCKAIPNKVTYAIYNGDTEKNDRGKNHTEKYYPQLVTRPQIRRNPPQILFTNPTMLNYMLVRSEDKPIFEKSQGKLKWILLDEAHTYTGSSAAELSLQLRRVLDAFGVTVDQVNFAVTSATIGDEKDPKTELKLKTFVSQLTGKPIDSIVVIGGKRVVPEIDIDCASKAINNINKRFNTHITIQDIECLRKRLNTSPALKASEIAKLVDNKISKDMIKSLELINAFGDKIESLNKNGSDGALLPSRANFFIRSISGLYACVNTECKKDKGKRVSIGSFTTYQSTNCPVCKSRMLEVATCPSCGGTILVGETSTSKGYRMHVNALDLESNPFYETNQDLIEEEESVNVATECGVRENDVEADGFTTFYLAKPDKRCLRHHTSESCHVFNMEKGRIEIAPEDANKNIVFKSLRHSETNAELCPHCGNKLGHVNYMRSSSTQMGRILSTLLLDNAETSNSNDAEVLYNGKKYITFTDNRQGSARSAMGMNQDVERTWIRSAIFHKLADNRLDNIEEGGLTPEEEARYLAYKQLGDNLPTILKSELAILEAKRNGEKHVPAPNEILWDEIGHILENNSDLRKLFKHLNEARGGRKINDANNYLKALVVDQFGWIPKRANSLETLGLVRLTYPDLKKANCPALLMRKGFKKEDWQSFLKICLDYQIRGGRHYMISGEYNKYLTQGAFTSAIYPQNSDLRKNGKPVHKWPTVRRSLGGVKAQEEQSRLVLLLCAALGYDDPEELDEEKMADIDGLLAQAWNFITSNILDVSDSDNHGYMLDLLGSKVRLQLIEKGYLCPVDNVIVDTIFAGYSPRMDGYIDRNNFKRFKIKTSFDYPYFPFKTSHYSKEELSLWIKEHFEEQMKHGVFSDITERVYAQKPIFISAEHSAQQSRDDLEKYEKEFDAGHLNILSCSTTMEMGVDIGGISEVVMNNVPPKSANYLQRAGRAGRRNESKALALTFCAPNPIGVHTWNNPEYPITHITETPLLKLESRQLIQRHVNALIFAEFVSKQEGCIRVTAQLRDFFMQNEGIAYHDKFLTYLDKIIDGNEIGLEKAYLHLTKNTCLEDVSLSDAAYSSKSDIVSVGNIYNAHLNALEKSLSIAKDNDGNSMAVKAIERQKENFLKTSLLSYLAENSFLPSAGIPTGLVECQLDLKNDGNFPTLHLSQAISAYAPGSQVVKNEWIYEPAGIRMKTKYDDNTSRYILQKCSECGYTTINYGSAMNNCPKCRKENSMHGIKDMGVGVEDSRFTEVVEPAAFSVAWDNAPKRNMNNRGTMNFTQPVLLEMEKWPDKGDTAKIAMRCSTPKSEILFYNRGRNSYGFAFCPYCGKMEAEKDLKSTKRLLSGHRHLVSGVTCPGGESNGNMIRRHVLLVGRYQTDFVEIKFYNNENVQVTDTDTLYSLGVILNRKLTQLLGVNDDEIDFGYDQAAHTIFIYDTALGGAGYSPLLREYRDKVLEMAYKTLNECNCECACTKCLIDRRSQWYLNYLDRKKALEWMEMERKSRIAPKEVTAVVPNAHALTTDLATEMYQLMRNKDVKSLNFFISKDLKGWNPDEFRYFKKIKEFELAGQDVCLTVKGELDLYTESASVRATVLPTILEHKFRYYQGSVSANLCPLLFVSFNDGATRTYFGIGVSNALSEKWGEGNVYSFDGMFPVSFSDVDVNSIIKVLTDTDNSIMFETRLKGNCNISSLFKLMIAERNKEWGKIKNAFSGKTVSITYSDRYLKTPLGIMLLANLISSIQKEYSISIASIKITVSQIRQWNLSDTSSVIVDKDFTDNSSRNKFMESAITEICGIVPEISDMGYIEHERCLTVKSADGELCIRPDAGISYGWKVNGYANANASSEDFEYNWDMDLPLYNQKWNSVGILYTVSYTDNRPRK